MAHGIEAARMGAMARQAQLDGVAQNMANVSTTGYHASRAHFREELVAANEGSSGVASPERSTDFRPGPIETTRVPSDLAIQGEGFFVVERDGRNLLTRRGDFQLGADGRLRTQQGDALLAGDGKPLRVDPDGGAWHVGHDGQVVQDGLLRGQLRLQSVTEPNRLEPLGGGVFDPGDEGLQGATGGVVQGALEMSNVQATTEMTEMIRLHRFFESMQTLIQTHTRVDQRAIQVASER